MINYFIDKILNIDFVFVVFVFKFLINFISICNKCRLVGTKEFKAIIQLDLNFLATTLI